MGMQVPFNDLSRSSADISGGIAEAIERVIASGRYVMGPEHDAFEREFAAYCGRGHAVGVANGTDALELSLRCLGVGPGDEVITVSNAGGYATIACLSVGAVPVFADVDAATLTMSSVSMAEAVSDRTRAVVVTHLYGKRANVAKIRAALGGRDVGLIEDCAQSHGVRPDAGDSDACGTLATYSFYPTKNLGALGDGGAVVADDSELAERLRRLRQYGWAGKYRADIPGGRNSRLDELQAAILRVKLPYLDAWNARRREIVSQYRAAAEGRPLVLIHEPGPDFVGHLCVGRHPDREAFRNRMTDNGVETAIHYPELDHGQHALARVPWRSVSLSVSERAVGEIVSLPCFPQMRDDEVDYVCKVVREFA